MLLNLLQGLREGAVVPSEQIDFALDLLNGKCSADHTPPPAPWSTEAFRQLEKYSWEIMLNLLIKVQFILLMKNLVLILFLLDKLI